MGPVRQLRTARRTLRAALCAAPLLAAACTATPQRPAETPVDLGGVRVYAAARTVEFNAAVAVDTKNPDTPDVYLELVACTPDTREHESLVVSPATPSLIHAALLAIDLAPGAPGRIDATADGIVRTPATGDRVAVTFHWKTHTASPDDWVRAESGEPVTAFTWVFAGSRFVTRNGREVYDADGTGTVIGLTTFGAEVIALTATLSPDSGTDAPMFLANKAAMPPRGTPVVVRIAPAE